MANTVSIKAERRAHNGKGAARQLRLKGKVPAVVYGHGRKAESLELVAADLDLALTGIAAESTLIDLSIGGSTVKSLIREIQRHPTRLNIIHVDFYEITAGQKITVNVPIHLEGTPDGVRNAGGILDQVLRELEIEVLPSDLPERITVDVTNLGIHKSIHVGDLKVDRATILTEPGATVCTVVPPRAEEVVAPAAEPAAEPAEPELIRKPKAEDEEGEGEAPEPAKAEKPEKPEKPEKKEKKKEG